MSSRDLSVSALVASNEVGFPLAARPQARALRAISTLADSIPALLAWDGQDHSAGERLGATIQASIVICIEVRI